MRDVLLEVGYKASVFWGVRTIVGVIGDTSDSRKTTASRLLVDDHVENIPHHEETNFTLRDAGKETLVHQLASSLLATLEILARESGSPFAGFGGRSVHAEFEELANSMVLDVVVVHFHELDLVAIQEGCIPKVLAVGLILQPAQPDSLASRTTVLLDHTWLEGTALLESSLELFRRIVGVGVWKTNGHLVDHHKGILSSHGGLHLRGGPHGLALGHHAGHELIEALLGSSESALGKLPWVDAHNESIVALGQLCEVGVLVIVVLDNVTAVPGLDNTVGDRNRVDAVTVGALIGTAVLGAGNVELNNGNLVLWVSWLREELVVTLASVLVLEDLLLQACKLIANEGHLVGTTLAGWDIIESFELGELVNTDKGDGTSSDGSCSQLSSGLATDAGKETSTVIL